MNITLNNFNSLPVYENRSNIRGFSTVINNSQNMILKYMYATVEQNGASTEGRIIHYRSNTKTLLLNGSLLLTWCIVLDYLHTDMVMH